MRIKVSDNLPPYDIIVIVWGLTHEGPALGKRCRKDKGKDWDYWEAQPFYEVNYWTYGGIQSWQPIEGEP